MLVQATTPRPVFDPSRYPESIHIHTLTLPGVSDGKVYFNATTDPEHGGRAGKAIDPIHEYPIEGTDGFQALQYILPFHELFRDVDKKRNLALVPFCTGGFIVVIHSAFRADPHTYSEHVLSFKILMPVTGGGIIRLADSPFDIVNSTFDPWGPPAEHLLKHKNLELQESYNRTHKLPGNGTFAAQLRADRIRELEARAAEKAPEGSLKLLKE